MCGRPAVPEHQRQAQRDEVDLRGGRGAVRRPGLSRLSPSSRTRRCVRDRRVGRDGLAEQRGEVEPEHAEHPHRHHRGADDQQHGLDDLHPGGALHAADQHVDDHQDADDGDHDALAEGVAVRDLQQQRDQRAGAGHLGQQVEERHHQRRGGRRGPHRTLPHPEAEHVTHRELAGVAQQLGDQQQRHQPGHQEADRVEEAVVAVDRDRARRCRGTTPPTGSRRRSRRRSAGR